MSRESAPIAWRAIKDGCTRNLQGVVETVVFSNPGTETIFHFRGQYYWHKPITDETGIIGHESQWSLVPPQYNFILKRRGIVGNKT